MDAVRCERAAPFGYSEVAATCSVYAATYPECTSAVVLFSPSSSERPMMIALGRGARSSGNS
jgi:hypothetical protein